MQKKVFALWKVMQRHKLQLQFRQNESFGTARLVIFHHHKIYKHIFAASMSRRGDYDSNW